MTSRLIYRLLAKWYNDLPVCVFALNVKTVLVLNEDYSNILCYLNCFHFFSLLLASVLAPNVKHYTQNDLGCQIKYYKNNTEGQALRHFINPHAQSQGTME